jgi:UDP-N-acetyl-2-amino-2-deoxyglucuronate dehydrogenase
LSIDGDEFELSAGFTELHTKSYEEIIAGKGFGIGETKAAIELVH